MTILHWDCKISDLEKAEGEDGVFDFDTMIDRSGTGSEKWEKYAGKNIIPMWVADMDFRSPPAVIDMLERDFGWKVESEWLVWLPGLVCGLNVTCRAVGEEGDEVLTLVPVYPPFLSAPRYAKRGLVRVPLREAANRWSIDFDRVKASVTERSRLFMLCNPHNPVGRVFERPELVKLAELCLEAGMIVCADEIHCGLVLDPAKRHIPFATLGHEVAERTITLMAPSKTFNLAGLGCAFAVIPSKTLRHRFVQTKAGIVPMINPYGYVAAEAAYRDCEEWRQALIACLRGNCAAVEKALQRMPGGLCMAPVEGTYLAWIDLRKTGLEESVRFFEESGVGLQDGREFDGAGFVRLNFGCPRSVLDEGLKRMQRGLEKRFMV